MLQRLINVNTYIDRQPSDISTSDITMYLSEPITIRQNQKVSIQLEQIELPNTAYSFRYHSYIFYYIHNVGGTNTLRSISLDLDRTYTDGFDVVDDLTQKATNLNYGLTFTYNDKNYKITVINNNNVSIRIIGSFRYYDSLDIALSNGCDRLGFSQDTTNIIIGPNQSLQGATPVRLLPTNCYYIESNIISNSLKQNIFPSPFNNDRIVLARVSAANFGLLSELQFSTTVELNVNNTTNITSIKFTILDDELFPIDLNGFPITFTLRLTIQ